jgi:Zn-dependent protease/CBS domain-containing protein
VGGHRSGGKASFHLARVAGIDVDAHWSLFLIAGLLVWTLAAGLLPEIDPGHPVVAYWVVAVVAIVVFYGSLVAHELAHATVARRQGVVVQRITLWLFGGVAQLGSESGGPRDELRMAVAGPATSLALGVGFVGAGVLADAVGVWSLAVTALLWLGQINLVLGVFNLLPAFPLDGGRVLRAWLWHRRGDRIGATVTAARIGVGCAYGLVGLGVLGVVAGLGIGGLWFVLLGWFLLGAARREEDAVTQQELLGGVTVGTIMSPDPVVVPATTTVADLVDRYVLGRRHSSYPVVDRTGTAVGLMTLDRIRGVPLVARDHVTVGGVAIPLAEVPVTDAAEPVLELLPRLAASEGGRALVLHDGRLVGIVSMTDVTRAVVARRTVTGRAA